MGIWQLIEKDRFEEACAEADKAFAATGSLFEVRNKVTALLKLGRLAEAETTSAWIEAREDFSSSRDSVFLGVSRWLQEDREGAVEAWKTATKAKYTDAAGGIGPRLLLLFAAKTLGLADLEEAMFRALRAYSPKAAWPAPLASFAVGRLSKEQVRVQIATELYERQSCAAEFYFGVFACERSERLGHFWRAAYEFSPDAYLEPEHYLAIHEFKAMEREK